MKNDIERARERDRALTRCCRVWAGLVASARLTPDTSRRYYARTLGLGAAVMRRQRTGQFRLPFVAAHEARS